MRPSRVLLTLGISAGTFADSSTKIIPAECADLLLRAGMNGGTSKDYRIVHQCCIGYDAPCPHVGNSGPPQRNSDNPPDHLRKRDYHGLLPEPCVNTCSVAFDNIDGDSSETFDDLVGECLACLDEPQDYTPTRAKSTQAPDSGTTTLISPPINARNVYGSDDLPDSDHPAIPVACRDRCSRSPDDGLPLNRLESCVQCVVEQAQQSSEDSRHLGARDHGNKSPMPCYQKCQWMPREETLADVGARCLKCLVASGALRTAPGVVAAPRKSGEYHAPISTLIEKHHELFGTAC